MKKLERLTQNEAGRFFMADNTPVSEEYLVHAGRIQTLTVQNPCHDINKVLDEMAEEDSAFIPPDANTYTASDFNGGTQHIRDDNTKREERMYSVYAIQFYHVFGSFFKLG